MLVFSPNGGEKQANKIIIIKIKMILELQNWKTPYGSAPVKVAQWGSEVPASGFAASHLYL